MHDDDPMKMVAIAIENANATENTTGFHAELFYNELTKEYTIGFAGSGKQLSDWLYNNAPQALGKEFPQQILSNAIITAIKMLPDDAKINIVGHSLGGALASYVGLATGKPAYTYNAEGISDNILKENGLLEKKENKDYNITAYYTTYDILSNTQDDIPGSTIVASAIGNRVELGDLNNVKDASVAVTAGVVVGALSGNIKMGTKAAQLTYQGIAHKMEPIVKHNLSKYGNVQNVWNNNQHAIGSLNSERSRAAMRTLSSVPVIIYD